MRDVKDELKIKEELIIFVMKWNWYLKRGWSFTASLKLIGEEITNLELKEVISEIYTDIMNGANFSASIKKFPDIFDTGMVAFIEGGEYYGILETVFGMLPELISRQLCVE